MGKENTCKVSKGGYGRGLPITIDNTISYRFLGIINGCLCWNQWTGLWGGRVLQSIETNTTVSYGYVRILMGLVGRSRLIDNTLS